MTEATALRAVRLWQPLMLAALVALFLVVGTATATSARDQERNLCDRGSVRNYLEPIQDLPPLPSAPTSGRLHFAPRGVLFHPIGGGLRVGRGMIGFNFDDRLDQRRELNWRISAELFRIGPERHTSALVEKRAEFVGSRRPSEISVQRFVVGPRPGYYSVRVSIENRAGELLGGYGKYFRVVHPSYKADLVLSSTSIASGTTLIARVENRGTEAVVPRSRFVLQRYDGIAWVEVAAVVPKGLRSRVMELVPGGMAGRCATLVVDQPPGRYRIVNRVLRPLRGQQAILTATFAVQT